MRIGRTIGVVVGLLAVVLAGAPAQAAPPTSAAVSTALVPSPGISPAADRVTHVGRDDFFDYDCRAGRACLAVWDVNTGNWKVFDLFRCGSYRLSYWNYEGGLKNNQTGGVSVRTFGSGGAPRDSYPPAGQGIYEVDWTPVWTVRPC